MRADCSWELPKDAGYDGEPLIVIATARMSQVTLATSLVGFCACRVVTPRLNEYYLYRGRILNCPLLIKFRTNCFLLFT